MTDGKKDLRDQQVIYRNAAVAAEKAKRSQPKKIKYTIHHEDGSPSRTITYKKEWETGSGHAKYNRFKVTTPGRKRGKAKNASDANSGGSYSAKTESGKNAGKSNKNMCKSSGAGNNKQDSCGPDK